MKNDRRTYRRPREPVNTSRFAWKPSEGNDVDAREACNIIRLPALRKVIEKPPTGFSESDVGKSPGVECDVSRFTDDATLYDTETTKFTNTVIHHSCKLDMEQVLPEQSRLPDWDIGKYSQTVGNRYREAYRSVQVPQVRNVSLSWMTGQIHNANEAAFGNEEMKQKELDRLQLEVGESYSNKLLSSRSSTDPPWHHLMESDSSAADDFAGPPLSWRFRYWYNDHCWQNDVLPMPLSVRCLAEWESVMVESVRLVLQRWRGVCSFSQTMRSTGAMKKVIWCMTFAPKNEVGPENDLLRSYSKVQKYDDISIT